jgi:hypothetical protein
MVLMLNNQRLPMWAAEIVTHFLSEWSMPINFVSCTKESKYCVYKAYMKHNQISLYIDLGSISKRSHCGLI